MRAGGDHRLELARARRGDDRSGAQLVQLCDRRRPGGLATSCLPDDRDAIAAALRRLADEEGARFVFTTGGTGLTPDDVTPEATRDVIDREAPGLGRGDPRRLARPHAAGDPHARRLRRPRPHADRELPRQPQGDRPVVAGGRADHQARRRDAGALAERAIVGAGDRRAGHRCVGCAHARQPELTLHALPPSHPCMTAEAALKLKGLEYERVDFQPGPHVEEMAQLYGEGNTHRARADRRRRAGARLARDPRPARAARARSAAVPRRHRGRRARGRALGRRGAAGPRPAAAVGRDALPARGDGHLRRRRAARPGGHRLRDQVRAPGRGSTTGSRRSAWPRTSPACPRSSTTSTRSRTTA